jgi:LL-diaminopimelate aminotransferase
MAFLDPDDVALVPDPGYAVYASAARFAGAEVVTMPLLAANHFLPDFNAIPANVRQRAKLLWVNYPNNPTGAVASEAFFAELLDFAHAHQILVCHDAPYLHVTFDGYRAPSLLQMPGAREVTVEFNSLSKTYNMAGWRLGMACGHAPAIAALHSLKSNIDSSQFPVIQDAGIKALTSDQSWCAERNKVYQERRDIVLNGLSEANLIAHKPQAAMYVWAQIPQGRQSGEFTRALLEEIGVSVTPGSFFGECGEGYFRISLSTSTPRVQEAMKRISAWL